MNRALEQATKVAAVTALLAAYSGEVASADTTTVTDPIPAITRLATQVDSLPTQPGASKDIARYSQTLPGNQRASIVLVSGESAHGQPEPGATTYLGISVRSLKHVKKGRPAPAPTISLAFMEDNDGTWSASSEAALPGNGLSSIVLGETGQTSITQRREKQLGGGVVEVSSPQTTPDAAGANQFLASLLVDAQVFLQGIIDGQAAPQ